MSERSEQTKETIKEIMKEKLSPVYLEIEDESWRHEGHAAAGGGGHFNMIVVSESFSGVSLMNRNRMVFDLLKEMMQTRIHALAIKAKTPEEWTS